MSISEQAMAFSRLLATMREELLSAHIGTIKRAPLYRIEEQSESLGVRRCRLLAHDGGEVVSWREGIEWESGSTVGRVVFEVVLRDICREYGLARRDDAVVNGGLRPYALPFDSANRR